MLNLPQKLQKLAEKSCYPIAKPKGCNDCSTLYEYRNDANNTHAALSFVCFTPVLM